MERVSKRILRFLQRRGVIILVAAPGDGEMTVVPDETLGEQDPLLAKLLAAATTGAAPAGPASQRQPIRIVLAFAERPVAKGTLCATGRGFNLQMRLRRCHARRGRRQTGSRKVVPLHLAPAAGHRVGSRPAWPAVDQRGKVWNPSQGFHPNDRLSLLADGSVRLDFKKPWSDGTSSVDLPPLALIARLAALVPPPRRHLTRYCGVLSSHASLRSRVVPQAEAEESATEKSEKPARKSKYIPWAELLRRTFGFEIVFQKCQAPLRLIALVKNQELAARILVAMHLPAELPELHPARPPPASEQAEREAEDWVN